MAEKSAVLISFPDLLCTKPKARSGQIRFALRDYLSGMWQGRQVRMLNIRSNQGRFFRIQQAYGRLTTWLTNNRSNLKISLLSRNQTSTKWGPKVFSTTWPHLFQILLRQSENFDDFCKVLSQFAFRNMIVPFNTSSSARALKLPSISHKSFLTQKVFTKSSPFSELLSSNLGKTLLVLAPGMPFSNGDWAT